MFLLTYIFSGGYPAVKPSTYFDYMFFITGISVPQIFTRQFKHCLHTCCTCTATYNNTSKTLKQSIKSLNTISYITLP